MAYSKDNLTLDYITPLNGSRRNWTYRSADAIATVNTSGYIDNAYDMGMKKGDLVKVYDTTNFLDDICMVANAPTAASPGADLTDGLRVTATNSD